jgi:hypothetical protein
MSVEPDYAAEMHLPAGKTCDDCDYPGKARFGLERHRGAEHERENGS